VIENRLEFRILGPLEVRADGVSVPLGGPKQRALLGLLLLSANRVVSRERLVEELAQDQNGSTADRTLKVQVSRLRKALTAKEGGAQRLFARPPGYVLRVEPGELDLELFEQAVAEGRRALTQDDPERAARLLQEGLSLWRGRPFADLEFEPFARVEIERLEELRLGAIEEWAEAELALGRHAALVPELEALVAEQPLRERLQGQLMLALYRSARHVDALRIFADSRRRLADELGLEPTRALRDLERAILRHDPSLAPTPRGGRADSQPPVLTVGDREPELAAAPTQSRSPARIASVLGRYRRFAFVALLACAAIAVAVPLTEASGGNASALVPAKSVGVIDPRADRVVKVVPVGQEPGDLAVGEGAVWVLNRQDETVSRINPITFRVHTVRSLPESSRLTVGAGGVWVTAFRVARISGVARLDPGSGVLGSQISIPASGSFAVTSTPIAAGAGSVWLTNGSALFRINARSQTLANPTVLNSGAGAVEFGAGSLWVGGAATGAGADDAVARIAASGYGANDLLATIPLPAEVTAIAVGGGSVWVAAGDDVVRISPTSNTVTATIPLGYPVDALAVGSGGAWVASRWNRTVARIDLATGEVVKVIRVGGRPAAIATGDGRVWVSAD
jgi:DNA-binding SARP family transcriptional activator